MCLHTLSQIRIQYQFVKPLLFEVEVNTNELYIPGLKSKSISMCQITIIQSRSQYQCVIHPWFEIETNVPTYPGSNSNSIPMCQTTIIQSRSQYQGIMQPFSKLKSKPMCQRAMFKIRNNYQCLTKPCFEIEIDIEMQKLCESKSNQCSKSIFSKRNP